MVEITRIIQDRLQAEADEKKARWLENYVKHDIRSRGVGIPVIREIVKEVVRENSLDSRPLETQAALLDDLMQQPFTEDKLAAILYLQLFGKAWPAAHQLAMISHWFDQAWISDWNVCDWLCVRILSPLVDQRPEETVLVLKRWNEAAYLWKARASLVPFAQCKTITDYPDTITELSSTLIKRPERFAKTSVGWVLREYSRHDEDLVVRFLEEYRQWASPEVIKNATKYLPEEGSNFSA